MVYRRQVLAALMPFDWVVEHLDVVMPLQATS